jgi:copper oxidase (laccase) domain-containing protein
MSVTLAFMGCARPYAVAFSTRLGGVSEGSFDSLNLGLMTHDEPANVEENRRLCEARAPTRALAMNRQVHAAVKPRRGGARAAAKAMARPTSPASRAR